MSGNNQPSTRPGNDRNPDRAEGKPDRHNADRDAHEEGENDND